MGMPTSRAVPVARSEPRTRTALLLEAIVLRHQIAVLERSRTRRPCFRRLDRLFWILLSRWWPQWRESLLIVFCAFKPCSVELVPSTTIFSRFMS